MERRSVPQISPLKHHATIRITKQADMTSAPIPKLPSALIHNPRQRDAVAFEAALKLAGMARVPAIQQPPPVLKRRATDSDLSEILRMTAERLQDGQRSSRRQTIFIHSKYGDPEIQEHWLSDSRRSSPTKTQRSAPVIMCEELDAVETSISGMQHTEHPPIPRHKRQASQVSIISDPDSLVAARRVSQPDHTTPLSSPSRNINIVEPQSREESQALPRPFSVASAESSALSTLYSEEGEQDAAAEGSRQAALDTLTSRTRRTSGGNSSESPAPYNTKRGTLGEVTFPRPLQKTEPDVPPNAIEPLRPRKTSLQFTIHAMDDADDPFTAKTPHSQDPLRLSQVFTPVPPSRDFEDHEKTTIVDTGFYPVVEVTRPLETPTPSPKSHRVIPLPIGLRTMTSSPTLGMTKRQPSPAFSEGGLSSVYESYGSSEGGTLDQSTATLITVLTNETQSTSGRMSWMSNRASCGAGDWKQSEPRHQVERLTSQASFYSQDQDQESEQDTVPPMLAPTQTNSHVANAVVELRRMNSTVSCTSGYSSVSVESNPVLVMARGGGFSPGKTGGGGKNYLAMGSPERVVNRNGPGRDIPCPGLARSGGRSRRGTIMGGGRVGSDGRREEPKGMLGEGCCNNVGKDKKRKMKIVEHDDDEEGYDILRLYDEKGFLKNSPLPRGQVDGL
ncbi:hypothetical protein JX265_013441 [Neoarthrinium moseri]|uniref:Uncharacterized protein n=1 Tax=Neoarthrinium moseri TaxID=1658444 RepID=A0A9Q0AIM3_9PEZI|nr:hypothetical protein JX265_013441 [Neoarthrinium moseri]